MDEDELYSWLSEYGHPRFAGLQTAVYGIAGPNPQAILHMGELPFTIPGVLHATTVPGSFLCLLSRCLGHVHLKVEVARRWPRMWGDVIGTILPGLEAVYAVLQEAAGTDESVQCEREFLALLRGLLARARELQAAGEAQA